MKKLLLEVPDEMVEAIDKRRGNTPRVAWIRTAIATRIGHAPDLTEPPSQDNRELHRPMKVIRPTPNPVSPPPSEIQELKTALLEKSRYAKAEKDCTHNFRNATGFCPSCGNQR